VSELDAPQPVRSRSRGIRLFVRDLILILLAALLVSFVVKTFFIRSFYVPSPSMSNTLEINDHIVVNLLSPSLMPLKNGDVVVFTDPGGWYTGETVQPPASPLSSAITNVLAFIGLTAPDDNDHLVKRVIGLPGDHVKCCNALGQVSVNDVPLKEPYIVLPPGTTKDDPRDFDITVPKGKLWVMGDNRYNSEDSAAHNADHTANPFVPISDVVGRAFVITWPISRWAPLSDYPTTFSGVPR
jgi:signal peptidase I